MPHMLVEFEVWCARYGDGICHLVSDIDPGKIQVEPCPTCIEDAEEDAERDGYQRGYDEGFEAGEKAGE